MPLIADTETLRQRLERAKESDYIAIDTEFMRDRSYWSRLCLVQIADQEGAFAIDPLAEGLELAPLYELLNEWPGTKVLHACRQDMEIFYHATGRLPHPIFDTQVAAMVLGYGDSVAYDTLVHRITGRRIDKGARFTDWARRPLSERQVEYALADVIHLRPVYERLSAKLKQRGRSAWVAEEMAILTDPATYRLDPADAWKRLKLRRPSPRQLARAQALAAWREEEAQFRDVPRNRVLRDEALLEVIAHPPKRPQDLDRVRGIGQGFHASRAGRALWRRLEEVEALPEDRLPKIEHKKGRRVPTPPVVDLLKLLLKIRAEEADVAPRLVASGDDLERLARGERESDIKVLNGWRHEVFGRDALALLEGRLAFTACDGRIVITSPGVDAPQVASRSAGTTKA